jgi:starvation-inducible DNA-binding protein
MLADSLKVYLASSFCFYLKAHSFHWNVEGPDFVQLHDFFGDIYTEVFESIDHTAEKIRTLDSYTPGSLTRFQELSIIEDQVKIPRAELMIMELAADNQKLIELLRQTFHLTEEADEQGIADYVAGRIDAHGKWQWQLKSLLKKQRA